jgi:hypothetical protein
LAWPSATEQRLDALALREEQAWQHVDSLISGKRPREYDAAVAVLLDLQALAERGSDGNAFDRRFRQLREQHLRKPSLIQPFDNAGLGAEAQRSGRTRVWPLASVPMAGKIASSVMPSRQYGSERFRTVHVVP